jgi:hypothetical protein
MLYEASANKQFIPMEELREVLDDAEMSTLMKMLRDIRIVVTRKQYIETMRQVKSVLGLPRDESSFLVTDSIANDSVLALNPAVVEEMRKENGQGELSYHMVRNFMNELLGQLELTSQVGSLNELVKDLSSKYESKFKIAIAKDIVFTHSCNLTDAERASLAAARLISPSRFSNVVSILLNRARRLAERISLDITEEDVTDYITCNLKPGLSGTIDAPTSFLDRARSE